MIVYFVGINPSSKSKTADPFHLSTRSGKTLAEWIKRLPPIEARFVNLHNSPTEGNALPPKEELVLSALTLRDRFVGGCVVALGNAVDEALCKAAIEHYRMPHPSGLNRQLNDPSFVEEKIKGLLEYLSKRPLQS